jgi:putative MATE family efflux protein
VTETVEGGTAYVSICCIFAMGSFVQILCERLLQSTGRTTLSMISQATGAITNILLDPLFIFGLDMGAAGAAIATVLSNAVSMTVYLYFVIRKARILSVSPRLIAKKPEEFLPVFSIGFPASVNNLMNSFGQIVCNRFLLLYGSEKLAAAGIASRINSIAVMMVVGFAFSAGPLIGYNFGQGNRDRLRKVLRFFYSFQIAMSSAVALVLMAAASRLVAAFMDDPAIVTLGTEYLRWHLISMPCMAIVMVSACVMQATGNSRGAMALSLSRQGVVFLGAIVILNALLGYQGVICAQAAADVISTALAVWLVRKSVYRQL